MPQEALNLGVVGYPLGHTLSPALHSYALSHYGLAGTYRAMPTAPERLAETLALMREAPMHGLNVTLPHKVAVIPWLDGFTARAAGVGAVNTVFWSGDRLMGDNTDVPGFLALAQGLELVGATALVLGAGGSARSVAWALGEAGLAEVMIAGRDLEAAETLAHRLESVFARTRWRPLAWPALFSVLPSVDVVVNSTPIGMAPEATLSPLSPKEIARLGDRAAVLDLVYRPTPTRLVSLATERGLVARAGLAMLSAQAADSFERWSGVTGARSVFEAAMAAIRAELGSF